MNLLKGERGASDLTKAPVVSLSKKLYSHCLVLVGSRNSLELEFTIKLN